MEKIIIDTDPGHDDVLAIMLIVKANVFNIKAVTTVAGNANIQDTTNNARFILDLLEADIPLFSGEKKPLKKELVTANVHGVGGLAGADIKKQESLTENAVDKIIEIVKKNPNEISLLVLGPQTNIAKAFLKSPELPALIKQIVIMGGAIDVPGNKNRVAEFNIFVDPDAAKVVFEANVRKVLIPLDICNDIPLFLDDFAKIKGKLKTPVLNMMKHFIKGIKKFELSKGALVYDALAAYYLINKNAYKTKFVDIKIETAGEFTSGMTVMEKRNWGEKNNNVNLVTNIDRDKFVEDFIKYLSY